MNKNNVCPPRLVEVGVSCNSNFFHAFSSINLTVSVPSVWISGDVWHHSRWKPAGGRMRAHGWLPRGLLEKHSSQQLQPPQPSSNQAVHSHSALQRSPHLWRTGNKHKIKRKTCRGWCQHGFGVQWLVIIWKFKMSHIWVCCGLSPLLCPSLANNTGNVRLEMRKILIIMTLTCDLWWVWRGFLGLGGGGEISDVSAVTFSLNSNLL